MGLIALWLLALTGSALAAPLVLPLRGAPMSKDLTLQYPAPDAALAGPIGSPGPGSMSPSRGILSLLRELLPTTVVVFGCGDGTLAVGMAQQMARSGVENPFLLCVDPGFSSAFMNAPPDADAGAVQHAAAEAPDGRMDPLGGATPQLHRFLTTATAAEPPVSGVLWPLARTVHLASFVARSSEISPQLLYIMASVDSRGMGADIGADGSGLPEVGRQSVVHRVADTLRRWWRFVNEVNGDMMESVMAGEGLPGSPSHEGAVLFANASCKRGKLHQRGSTWWLFRTECWSVV